MLGPRSQSSFTHHRPGSKRAAPGPSSRSPARSHLVLSGVPCGSAPTLADQFEGLHYQAEWIMDMLGYEQPRPPRPMSRLAVNERIVITGCGGSGKLTSPHLASPTSSPTCTRYR